MHRMAIICHPHTRLPPQMKHTIAVASTTKIPRRSSSTASHATCPNALPWLKNATASTISRHSTKATRPMRPIGKSTTAISAKFSTIRPSLTKIHSHPTTIHRPISMSSMRPTINPRRNLPPTTMPPTRQANASTPRPTTPQIQKHPSRASKKRPKRSAISWRVSKKLLQNRARFAVRIPFLHSNPNLNSIRS